MSNIPLLATRPQIHCEANGLPGEAAGRRCSYWQPLGSTIDQGNVQGSPT